MKSNSRIWVISGALVVVLVLALGGLLGVKPQLDAAQLSNEDRANVEVLNAQHAIELEALKEQSTRLAEFQAAVAELRLAIPATADLDTFTGELAALEGATGVRVTSYTPEDAALFAPSPTTAAVAPASIAASSFVKVSVKVSVVGTRDAGLAFVKGLQSGPRLVLISDVNVSAAEDGETTTDVTGLVYFLLETPYVDPAAAVPAPAPEAAAAE